MINPTIIKVTGAYAQVLTWLERCFDSKPGRTGGHPNCRARAGVGVAHFRQHLEPESQRVAQEVRPCQKCNVRVGRLGLVGPSVAFGRGRPDLG